MKSYAETLESYLIPAEEGLFSKIKENREKKKAEKEQRRLARQEELRIFKETSKDDCDLIKKICNDIINKAKQKWKSLPFDIYYNVSEWRNVQVEIDIAIFEDEWCMNKYNEKYIPEAETCFDFIYDEIEKALSDKNKFKNKVSVTTVENNTITINIEC